MVTGSDRPLITKRELFELAAVTVTFAPLAVRLPVADPLVPATTLPIAMGAGVAVSTPAVADPVPVKGMVKLGLEPVDVRSDFLWQIRSFRRPRCQLQWEPESLSALQPSLTRYPSREWLSSDWSQWMSDLTSCGRSARSGDHAANCNGSRSRCQHSSRR